MLQNIFFSEPRLKMTILERFIVKLITYSSYTILAIAAISFLFSDIRWIFWLGILILLFLLDRLLHFNQAERSLASINFKNRSDQKINAAQYLTPKSLGILENALEKTLIIQEDFFLCLAKLLTENQETEEMIERLDVVFKEFEQKIFDLIEENKADLKIRQEELISKIEKLSKIAFEIALNSSEQFIEPRDFFAALAFLENEKIVRIFDLFGITPQDLENALIFSRFRHKFNRLRRLPKVLGGFAHHPYKIRHRIMNRAWTAKPTPTLDQYAIDFTDLAREEKVGFLIGHREEYDQMVDVLSRQTKNSVLLVGEPSSGKKTIVNRLAFEIIKDKIPQPLFDKRLVVLEIGNLISGASAEEVSARVNKIIEEIISAGNIILYIPDIHNLVKTSGAQYLNAADILIPVITSDAFPTIGATYPKEFKQLIEPQSDFANAFEIIRINEISEEEAVKLLTYDSLILEHLYKIKISFGAIKEAVNLAHKYFHYKLLPSSAEELLKEALADASQKGDKILTAEDLIKIAERKTNIPIHRASKEETKKLLNLEETIHQRLINQEEAVKTVSQALREYRSGLARQGGPIAVFLFVGPTGVGKTELSKILAKVQFGSENLMLRFDMSEYQDKQSIFRFIGSPDAKIAGSLTEAIIQKPYSLILLDEFEKAHQNILNLFLQVFDDGRLTDNLGRVVDFTNTIIIATSNARSDFIKTHIEAHTPMEVLTEELKKKLTDYFKPELLNRFSKIVVFKTLSLADLEAIARLQLQDLADSLKENNAIDLSFDESTIKKIAALGFDPIFGARPLRAAISENLRAPLAEKILREEVNKGETVKVRFENEKFIFQ